MSKSIVYLIASVSMLSQHSTHIAFAEPAGRITGPINGRCGNSEFLPEQCTQWREKSLNMGCITPEEKDALFRFGAYPVCGAFEEPERALYGWCPCSAEPNPEEEIINN